ncbi:hypothetical protein HRbin41_01248 [bacterium HR41]|nr:hypothetical protein HRbin41_01248 [bacterium HR41]
MIGHVVSGFAAKLGPRAGAASCSSESLTQHPFPPVLGGRSVAVAQPLQGLGPGEELVEHAPKGRLVVRGGLERPRVLEVVKER